MLIAYRWMLFWLRRELIIARSTGRNPAECRKLQAEVHEYELLEFQHMARFGPERI